MRKGEQMATLDEIGREKQRISERLAQLDAERTKLSDQLNDLEIAARVLKRFGRVEMWRGGVRSTMSVAAPFVWRCLSGSAITPFPHPAHRTQQADFPHCALGQDLTPSPTTGRGRAGSDVRARSTRRGARVDSSRACVACPCASTATTGATAQPRMCRARDTPCWWSRH